MTFVINGKFIFVHNSLYINELCRLVIFKRYTASEKTVDFVNKVENFVEKKGMSNQTHPH